MKRRKIASLLLSILLIVSLSLPALAFEVVETEPKVNCQHQLTDLEFSHTYTDYDSSQHWLVSVYNIVCELCGATLPGETIEMISNYGGHDMNLVGSTHHNNGTHTWTYGCGGCGYRTSPRGSCSGPPCPDPV